MENQYLPPESSVREQPPRQRISWPALGLLMVTSAWTGWYMLRLGSARREVAAALTALQAERKQLDREISQREFLHDLNKVLAASENRLASFEKHASCARVVSLLGFLEAASPRFQGLRSTVQDGKLLIGTDRLKQALLDEFRTSLQQRPDLFRSSKYTPSGLEIELAAGVLP